LAASLKQKFLRTYQHIIDTKAIKSTLNSIPDHWVIRDLNERDYGIDLMIEIFSENGEDHIGHKKFEASGRVCYLQVKGKNQQVKYNKDRSISFPIEVKALKYVEKFATPFILVLVHTAQEKNNIYFLWLQRYIIDVLEKKHPNWRTKNQDSYTLRIPEHNYLPNRLDKIEKIAGRIKFIEEHSEYWEKYFRIKDALEVLMEREWDDDNFDFIIEDLKRLKNLKTLLDLNNCQVDEKAIQKLIDYVYKIKKGKIKHHHSNEYEDLIHDLDLLQNDNFMRMAGEELIAENYDDTVY
jgi:hypothetical protein